MLRENKILLLEKPNIEDINNIIEASGLVLCISLNEKESVSLVPPSYYYLHVHRYMYLCNIIPKCLEYFKSFILPFYGNKFGVYFECVKGKKNFSNIHPCVDIGRGTDFYPVNSEHTDTNLVNDEVGKDNIILDWRLPIGVLFDIYCDIENENNTFTQSGSAELNCKCCSNNELFPDHVSILEISSNGEREYYYSHFKKKDEKKKYNGNVNILAYNSCIPLYRGFNDFEECILNQLKKANYIMNKNDRVLQILSEQNQKEFLYHLKNFNVEKICSLYREHMDYNMVKFIDNINYIYIQNIEDLCLCNNAHDKGSKNGGSHIAQDKNEKGENCHFIHVDVRKDYFFSDEGEEEGEVDKRLTLPTRTHISFLVTATDVREEKGKKPSFAHLHDQAGAKIGNSENYLDECGLSKSKLINNTHVSSDTSMNTYVREKKDKQSTNYSSFRYGEHTNDVFLKDSSCPCCNRAHNGRNSIYDLMNDEKVNKDVPIIIHIYGPPYNQVLTKFPLFKIIRPENNESVSEGIFIYTLGDFLHKQFPSFFRKICRNSKGHSHNGKTNISTNNEHKERVYYDKENNNLHEYENKKGSYLNSENVFYFMEDDYLIFSPYMFIIVNGIQIPLKTPLYWLCTNFLQLDNFLHVILRIPPY
ncbi:autophagy protein 5, putative [Plasmodium malariae]|uniref:Autophagy protein 5 n=1 Tax=Plasmodium malariae TaxID=5858 RepID=A0A1C3KEZ2_PLAMA|nr:autophagy protein 5, putative [Plasmodium malariae]